MPSTRRTWSLKRHDPFSRGSQTIEKTKYMQNHYREMKSIVRLQSELSLTWLPPRHTMFLSLTPPQTGLCFSGPHFCQRQSFSQSLSLGQTSLSPCYPHAASPWVWVRMIPFMEFLLSLWFRLLWSHNQTRGDVFLTGFPYYPVHLIQKHSCERTSS